MTALRAQIEKDLENEARASRMRAIFDARDKEKRPPAERFTDSARCESPVSVEIGTPDYPGEGSDGFDYAHAAMGDYHAVCANQTGRDTPFDVWQKLRERRADQDAMSEEMATAIDSTGRFPEKRFNFGPYDPGRCTVIDLMTGEPLPLPPIRRVNFFPSIAAGMRSKMLRDIEHFIGCNPRRSRMYTFTNGPRVAIDVELRGNVQAFHRRLSKLAAKLRKRFGVSFEWRATEFGSPEWDPETGKMTLHLHAHLLVMEPESMHPKRRAKVRRKIWQLTRDKKTGENRMWDDSGEIQNAREFVKYPVKDADLETILRQGGPGMLADLYTGLRGLHIVQPMGELRAVRGKRRGNARRITAFTRLDGRTLEETGDWNAVKRPLAVTNGRRAEWKRQAQKLAARLACAAHCSAVGSAAGDSPGETGEIAVTPPDNGRFETSADDDEPRRGDSDRKPPRVANRILALLAPGPYGSARSAPAAVVWGFDGNVDAVLNQPRARAIIEAHRAAYIRGHALASNQSSQRSNNCPADDPPRTRRKRPDAEWSTEMLLEFAKN